MRRLTRSGFTAAAVLVAGVTIAIGGVLPASAAPAHPTLSESSSTTATSVTADGCTANFDVEFYLSSYGYDTVKTWFTSSNCSSNPILEAGITCWNSSETEYTNMWGREDTTVGDSYASVAACDRSWPTFISGGGYRIYYDGAWHYHTELY
jgi:hypothetical protein